MLLLCRYGRSKFIPTVPDDVVNNDSGPPPSVVTLASMEDKMTKANGIAGDVLAPETDCHSPLLPEDPVFVLQVVGKHWRVVTHLDVYKRRYMYILYILMTLSLMH